MKLVLTYSNHLFVQNILVDMQHINVYQLSSKFFSEFSVSLNFNPISWINFKGQ